MDNAAIGVDIGGTKVAVACVDRSGRILESRKFPTQREPQLLIETLVKTIKEMSQSPSKVGVGLAGQIVEKTGVVTFAPNLGWRDLPFQTLLQEALKVPVVIMNDVRAATWGEWKHGAGSGLNDLVCLFIGTGIGGGVVTGGELMRGASNCAGELGHMTIQIKGPLCTCGNHGCLEALAGGWALAMHAQLAVQTETRQGERLLELCGGQVENISARTIVEASLQGDPLSQQIVERAIEALTASCVGIVNAFNPARLILGGGLGSALPQLVERIQEGVQRSSLTAAKESLTIVQSQLKNEAGMVGAASYALTQGS